MKCGVNRYRHGIRHTLYFLRISWCNLTALFGLHNDERYQPMNKSAFCSSHTSLIPNRRPLRDGKFGLPESKTRTRNLIQSEDDGLRLIRLRFHAPTVQRGNFNFLQHNIANGAALSGRIPQDHILL